ncbi:hypothetical protein KXD40_008501 [Peronospora effusa]|nr:hypothetical protein KXD40_008501 [Peronospora effusa]
MSIRGTNAAQDGRYFTQEKKLLAKMTFPLCFNQHVDMNKVQREVISQWVTERITQLLGFEDEIVVAMAINLLEPKVDEKLDPKQLQMALTGFLEKQAGTFMEELWQLLLSAQSNPTGIPSSILDKKKREMQRLAEEKDQLKKVLDAKRMQSQRQSRDGDRREEEQKETVVKVERQSSFGPHGLEVCNDVHVDDRGVYVDVDAHLVHKSDDGRVVYHETWKITVTVCETPSSTIAVSIVRQGTQTTFRT